MLEQSEVYEDVDRTMNNVHSDTICTQAFQPQFDTQPLRNVAGADGYLSDPGYLPKSEELFHSMNNTKPYHYIASKADLTNLQLTPLQDISCITPSPTTHSTQHFANQEQPTVQRTQSSEDHDTTFHYINQDDDSQYSTEDSYGLLTQGPQTCEMGTSPIRNLSVKYNQIETQTGDKSLLAPSYHNTAPSYKSNSSSAAYRSDHSSAAYRSNHSSAAYRSTVEPYAAPPPPHPSTVSSTELRWFQYAPNNEALETTQLDATNYLSFNQNDSDNKVNARRPPVLDDFEASWPNVLNTSPTQPDWGLVKSAQWRMWFEFYKGISKVNKMKSLLVTTMMGSREACMKGGYINSAGVSVPLAQIDNPRGAVHDKSILYQPPPTRYKDTETAVISTDPVQVCIHLQNSGYKPALYIPSHPTLAGGEWRTGGAGPLEEFLRRSNYYQCIDDVDSPVKNRKRVPGPKFLAPTECQVHHNVTVFRDSQQRNYMFYDKAESINVVSVTPLPRAKREKENMLSKEESYLLKRKLEILFCTAAAEGCDSLILTPHLSEGRRAPHQHIAQIVANVCQSYEGIFRRIVIAIENDVIFHDISQQQLAAYNKVFPGSQIALPNSCPMPASQDIVLWHWVDDNGKWYPYTPKQNEGIEAYYLKGETYMSMKGPDTVHPGYVVDFNYFTIKSESTRSCRKIGRFKLVYDRMVNNKKRKGNKPTGNWVSAVVDETEKLYTTAVDETICQKKIVATWQWLNEDNVWVPYPVEQCNKLEEAYIKHGTACVILNIASTRYSVNTFSRVQTNTQTGKQRKVQRVMEDAPPPDVSPRMSSTPTPAGKPIVPPIVIWEHQGADKSWAPFDNKTSDLIENTYNTEKPTLTVVFNYQAYWIYLQPYMCLIDPKNVMEEFPIRRTVVDGSRPTAYGLQPQQLFSEPPSKPVTVNPHTDTIKNAVVRPVSNSTMIEDSMGNENPALYTSASDFSSVLRQIEKKETIAKTQSQPEIPRARTISTDSVNSVRVDGNNRRMQKTFMRHPSVISQLQAASVVRDPAKEFSWEWQDGDGLWHSLPEYIACFLEPASKTQGYGGVRTSKLTNGVQKVCVQANFNKCEIAGHIPGYPTTVSRLRRVEICLAPELS